jgi:hypothetical protein
VLFSLSLISSPSAAALHPLKKAAIPAYKQSSAGEADRHLSGGAISAAFNQLTDLALQHYFSLPG